MALLDFIAAGVMFVYVTASVQPVNTNDGIPRKTNIQSENYPIDYNRTYNSTNNIISNRFDISNSTITPYRP